jgi:hypothetical protein
LNEGEKWATVSIVDNNTLMGSVSAGFAVINNRENNSLHVFVQRLSKFTINGLLQNSNANKINNITSHVGEY